MNVPFDFKHHAEKVHNARSALHDFGSPILQKLRTTRSRETLDEWHEFRKTPTYQRLVEEFWTAIHEAYPPDFDEDFKNLRNGHDLKALETAVIFLEADPYFFRTGYIKEKLLRHIRGYQLTSDYRDRLQQVVLNIVDRHYCREFREYCKLARKIDHAKLRIQLQNRERSEDLNIRKRAEWVLVWLKSNEQK